MMCVLAAPRPNSSAHLDERSAGQGSTTNGRKSSIKEFRIPKAQSSKLLACSFSQKCVGCSQLPPPVKYMAPRRKWKERGGTRIIGEARRNMCLCTCTRPSCSPAWRRKRCTAAQVRRREAGGRGGGGENEQRHGSLH